MALTLPKPLRELGCPSARRGAPGKARRAEFQVTATGLCAGAAPLAAAWLRCDLTSRAKAASRRSRLQKAGRRRMYAIEFRSFQPKVAKLAEKAPNVARLRRALMFYSHSTTQNNEVTAASVHQAVLASSLCFTCPEWECEGYTGWKASATTSSKPSRKRHCAQAM